MRLARPHHAVPPRFRCLVCRVFVTGGPDGTCPRCGWHPPGLVGGAPARRRGTRGWLVAAAIAGGIVGAWLIATNG